VSPFWWPASFLLEKTQRIIITNCYHLYFPLNKIQTSHTGYHICSVKPIRKKSFNFLHYTHNAQDVLLNCKLDRGMKQLQFF
jgi:hypothetical protein